MNEQKMFKGPEDFLASYDKGIKLIQESRCQQAPLEDDCENLKHLFALFIGATIKMDPQAFQDPDLTVKLIGVREALLAAYNLGRKHAN